MRTLWLLPFLSLLLVWPVLADEVTTEVALTPGERFLVTCETQFIEHRYQAQPGRWEVTCAPLPATPTPAATATPTATATPAPPVGGWHPAGSHGGLNVHEHGDAPPAWVTGAFSQTRESHTGYKGALGRSPGGVESYLVAHIVSTETARSHGDHDYQLWLRDPETGQVFSWQGLLCFSAPDCLAPVPERRSDTGERPIVLGERSTSDGCETWYSTPGGIVADIGWTICGRYQGFDGTVLGGVGTFRTVDWVVPCDRLRGAARAALLDNCRVEFGVSRLAFLVQSRDYGAPGIAPVN